MNPRYTGRQVWNRQRRDEVLVDVEDVAQGHLSRMRWNDRSDWVWSSEQTHEAIISEVDFDKAQAQIAVGARSGSHKQRRANRVYVLSGRVQCGLCGHRMQGNYNHDAPHYRCKFPSDRGTVPGVDPLSVYVRESAIVPKLDEWIGTLFDPANLDTTCEDLAAAGGSSGADRGRIEAAQRKLADCDTRLTKYRTALDAGADPAIVTSWIAQVQDERMRAEREIGLAKGTQRFTKEQVRELVEGLGDIATVLTSADPKLKAQLYEKLGISVIYEPRRRIARIESRPESPWARVSVGGPDYANPDWRIRPLDLER
jgi:site-specific DNA recombinase